jgi:hypothetical protein
MTNFNPHLNEFSDFVSITSKKDKFLNEINNQIKDPRSEEVLKEFAKRFDWNVISEQYYYYILDLMNENKKIK